MAEIPQMSRLYPIQWLSDMPHFPGIDMQEVSMAEQAAYNLHERENLIPTIGCEIEVKSSALFPDLASEFFGAQDKYGVYEHRYPDFNLSKKIAFDGQYHELDSNWRPWYEATKTAGIPAGSDAYWEFANAPAFAWQTLEAEVCQLFGSGLIPDQKEHSLHVTLGGIEVGRGGMGFILGGLELMYVRPERIIAATMPNRYGTQTTWARRGIDGLRQRDAGILKLGHTVGTELRTLSVENADQAAGIFEASQVLASMLAAYRRRKDSNDPYTQELANQWTSYTTSLSELWRANGLPIEPWGNPRDNNIVWQRWAEVIGHREEQSSLAQETIRLFHTVIENINKIKEVS